MDRWLTARREGQARRPAEPEDRRRQAGGRHRPVRGRPRGRHRGHPRRRRRLPPAGVPDPLRHPAPGGRWPVRQRQGRLPAAAAGPRLVLLRGRRPGDPGAGHVHRRRVGPPRGRLPRRRLRLVEARPGSGPGRDLARLRRRRRTSCTAASRCPAYLPTRRPAGPAAPSDPFSSSEEHTMTRPRPDVPGPGDRRTRHPRRAGGRSSTCWRTPSGTTSSTAPGRSAGAAAGARASASATRSAWT